MRTIETTIQIDEGHRASIQFPADLAPGSHRVVLVIEEAVAVSQSLSFASHDIGPWPEGLTLSREVINEDYERGP
jgi:hypothetical protein